MSTVNKEPKARFGRSKGTLSYREKLNIEQQELEEKFIKLSSYIEADNFQVLRKEEQTLLQRQLIVMSDYLAILDARLTLMGAESTVGRPSKETKEPKDVHSC